ncbi:transmembrane protein 33 [Galendromus occidentalis]|uniref:Transmembrane protein 33 n=1 Tax=Galendromus occidentalis TaxID=34638 RepID=A0AAJ6VYK1_9ACAR|nr:transmembrane protein 33 [Galendromus occidentalis]
MADIASPGSARPDAASGGDQQRQANQGPKSLKQIFVDFVEKHFDSLLWISRMSTIMFTVLYFLGGPSSYYQKALMTNGVTSALRLHQRIPEVRLNVQFLARLVTEDSFHYLFYSFFFLLLSSPVSVMVLVPPLLFAVLHSASFSIKLLTKAGLQNSKFADILRTIYLVHRVSLFQIIAMTEIMLMVILIIGVFTGRMMLMAPFIYYRFLSQRYASNRNPYSRYVCRDLRVQLESAARHRSCPPFISRAIFAFTMFVSSRAPVVTPAQHQQ